MFHISMCPIHQMVNLPKCLMCIEAERAASPMAA
jgi:hypothetical protein